MEPADVDMGADEGGGENAQDNSEDWDGLDDEDEDMPEFFKEANADQAKNVKTPSRNPKSKVALVVRAKVSKVLLGTDLAEKRARQCDQNDFLRLLLGRSPPPLPLFFPPAHKFLPAIILLKVL